MNTISIEEIFPTSSCEITRMMASGRECPITLGNPTNIKMTRNGFISACLAHQKRRMSHDMTLCKHAQVNSCTSCKRGEKITEGKPFRAPRGVVFLPLKKLITEMEDCNA